jgi:hypothetical protein
MVSNHADKLPKLELLSIVMGREHNELGCSLEEIAAKSQGGAKTKAAKSIGFQSGSSENRTTQHRQMAKTIFKRHSLLCETENYFFCNYSTSSSVISKSLTFTMLKHILRDVCNFDLL